MRWPRRRITSLSLPERLIKIRRNVDAQRLARAIHGFAASWCMICTPCIASASPTEGASRRWGHHHDRPPKASSARFWSHRLRRRLASRVRGPRARLRIVSIRVVGSSTASARGRLATNRPHLSIRRRSARHGAHGASGGFTAKYPWRRPRALRPLVPLRRALTIPCFNADEKDASHEFVMVADNLGSIPPNTSLMIITAGEKRYELFVTSTEQKNAVVKIVYQPE